MKLLLTDPRIEATDCDEEAIRSASKNGFLKIVEILLKYSSEKALTCISAACKYGHLDVVERLFKEDIIGLIEEDIIDDFDLQFYLDKAIRNAISKGYLEILKFILKQSIFQSEDYDYDKYSIWYASENGHLQVVKH